MFECYKINGKTDYHYIMGENKTEIFNLLEGVPKYCKIKVLGFNPPLKLNIKLTNDSHNHESELEVMACFKNIEPSRSNNYIWKTNPKVVHV